MPESGGGVRLHSSARTSVGQVRENNEDSVHLWSDDEFVLAVVADGMGGAAAGEEASQLAIEAIQAGMPLHTLNGQQTLKSLSDDRVTDRLSTAIQQANLNIIERAVEEPGMHGMGTTVTLAFVRGKRAIVAHVGDSRAYRVHESEPKITQITSDHSFVEALLAAGHITEAQAQEHPMKNVLYRALGQAEDLDVDVYSSALDDGDRLVLCTDGLTRHVKPEEIAELVLAEDSASDASKRLIDLANERGGEDNVSVIVIQVESTGEASNSSKVEIEHSIDDTLILPDRDPTSKANLEMFKSTVEAGKVAEADDDTADDVDTLSLQAVTPDVDVPGDDKLETGTQQDPKDPLLDTAVPSLRKDKMQAERVSDKVEPPDSSSDSASSSDIQPPEPISGASSPSQKPSEGDGEGHDTRSPEQ
jgi:protein phosphatase